MTIPTIAKKYQFRIHFIDGGEVRPLLTKYIRSVSAFSPTRNTLSIEFADDLAGDVAQTLLDLRRDATPITIQIEYLGTNADTAVRSYALGGACLVDIMFDDLSHRTLGDCMIEATFKFASFTSTIPNS